MSRSYRKPYYYVVSVKDSTLRRLRELDSRSYRHRLNRGEFDELPNAKRDYCKAADLAWDYDLIKLYGGNKPYGLAMSRK